MARSTLSVFVLLSVLLGCQKAGENAETKVTTNAQAAPAPDTGQPDLSIQIRKRPEEGQTWNRGDAIRVRLDAARLRAYDLSMDDVMKGIAEGCAIVATTKRVDPPPGIVFETILYPPERYEQIIVKASADGEIVRIKDVGKVELLKAQEAEPR